MTARAADLPLLLLISDSLPSKDGGGISQTLYNVFDGYPRDKLIYLADRQEIAEDVAGFPGRVVACRMNTIPLFRGRVGSLFNGRVAQLNAAISDVVPPAPPPLGRLDNAVLLASTTYPTKLHYAYRLHQRLGVPIVPYFMDDWIDAMKFRWLTGDSESMAGATLRAALGWMMISERLNDTFRARFGIEGKPTLVVHNPVIPRLEARAPRAPAPGEPLVITYAGSIWPMHYDAIRVTAQAVRQLRADGCPEAELRLYCRPSFWARYGDELGALDARYMGYVEYQKLHDKLDDAWLLLVASAFDAGHAPFARSSVQTKLTDYMNACKPVLSVGPPYSACHGFVKQWDCGYVHDTADASELARRLVAIRSNRDEYARKAWNGYNAVRTTFAKPRVQLEVQSFLQSLVAARQTI